MTNKEKQMVELRSRYPDMSEEFLELCHLLSDYDKTKRYTDILDTCSTYADIANKVVRLMYVNGDIDDVRAKSEKFLSLLLPLACLGVQGNSHAAVYHVKQMLGNSEVREERKWFESKRREVWRASQKAMAEQQTFPFSKITIEITDPESMRLFIEFLQSAGTKFKEIASEFLLQSEAIDKDDSLILPPVLNSCRI
ncbi:hypothetical protein [Bacteroides sp.]|uniref:hypothetical protein n=1 Tax=Bacteroides sp. TaxID=29523 RepID=UPI0023D73B39|nr:hypothetical protein [Bacteroides sp.]MDE6215513.1 hypothetical protein [Bacteroides sp.]